MAIFHDYVQGAGPTDVDTANRVSIGTITLSQHARSIRRVWAMAVNVGTDAQSKPLVGYITLESEDVNIQPFKFPFSPTPSHLGATPHSSREKALKFFVNCQAVGGARIVCYATLGVGAPQAAPEIFVCIEYSDGGPEGQQIHMEVLEPSGALSTGDGDVTTMSDVSIKRASRLILVWAVASVATLVADESVIVGMKLTCSEFAQAGPLKFPLEPEEGGDATTSGTHLIVGIVETDRPFAGAPIDATLTPEATQYDANNAAPECYVGVAFV